MTRNLKALGLALIAALALGAIGAQGASAVVEHSFRSDAQNAVTVLTGQNEGQHTFRAGTGGPTIHCTEATFSGTNAGNIRDFVTVHPKYNSCTAFGAAAPVTTDGCNYELFSNTTSGGHFSGEHAAVSVECEPNHDITVDAACKVTFQESHNSVTVNRSLHGVTYAPLSNNHGGSSKHSITVKATVGGITYTTVGGLACIAIGKPQGTLYTDGIYEGNVSVTGYEDNTGVAPTSSTTIGTTWHHSTQVNITVSTPT